MFVLADRARELHAKLAGAKGAKKERLASEANDKPRLSSEEAAGQRDIAATKQPENEAATDDRKTTEATAAAVERAMVATPEEAQAAEKAEKP